MDQRDNNINPGLPGYVPEIGRAVWQLEDTRQRTLERLAGFQMEAIDWQHGELNSIETLLYHIAAIEMDWLFAEVLEQDYTQEVIALFPYDVRDAKGRLTVVTGMSLEEHLSRLEKVRTMVLDTLKSMTLEDFRRVRVMQHYDVTPEWVIHHLVQHESEHQGEMMTMHTLWKIQNKL